MKIIRLDGTEVDINSYSLRLLKYRIASPTLTHLTEKIEGRDGEVFLGSEYENRPINAEFMYESQDLTDYYLLKTEFYRLFATRSPFYIVFKREPGKRWLVRLSSPFEPEKVNHRMGSFNVEFMSDNPFAESIGTTLDPITFDGQLWQIGQGITLDESMYTHSTTNFLIYNATDGISIDPRQMPLEITFKGASSNLAITNNTTGDIWQYTKTTESGDTLLLTGVRSLKNGLSVFSDTNHKLITLAPGYNDFTISGTNGAFTISFAFRFYTL